MLEMHECFIANILADALQLQFRSPCGWRSIWHSRLTSFKLLNCFDMLALLQAYIASWTSNTFCNICVSSLSWGRCIDFRNEGRLRTKRNAAFNNEFNSEYMILQKQETYTARDCAWWFYHDDPRSACHVFCFHPLILASRTHDRRFLQSESSKGVHARLPLLRARPWIVTFAQNHSSCWIRVGRIRVHTITCIRQKADTNLGASICARDRASIFALTLLLLLLFCCCVFKHNLCCHANATSEGHASTPIKTRVEMVTPTLKQLVVVASSRIRRKRFWRKPCTARFA